MAVSLDRKIQEAFRRTGTLAQLSVAGGAAPREILKEIEWADWGPDGKSVAVVRVVPGRMRIEYPIGKLVYETSGWVSHVRVSPDGDLVGFIDHPTPQDDGGSVAVVAVLVFWQAGLYAPRERRTEVGGSRSGATCGSRRAALVWSRPPTRA